ncbi:hypothetical protein NW752_003204 [Fusarium irregulare]|uniref:Nucleotidyl transferase n=1 Tax=Fusarium irregulare TaxID=2494466 RepID=A0A9W8UGF8_9HYPO|nr:hypothetical protein NW766_000879 [Fusarium irregulare]KAJ4025728.1 hypothetical protein NW752_003204 [Fusarium irregulare]
MEPVTPSQFNDMKVAAEALSKILTENDIKFALIGGFAVYLLGGGRSTLDIDVYVDMDINNIRERFKDIVCTADSRFDVDGLKVFFAPGEGKERIPIETLALGSLGLPRTISVFYPDNGTIPVLVPGVLILTKIKRAVQYIGSTRPQSITKYKSDVYDIVHLLDWLNIHDQKIGFSTYEGASTLRLYDAVGKMRNHWLSLGHGENVQLLDDALNEEDALSVKCSAIHFDRN